MTNSSSETVTVRLVGGPDDWHGHTLDIYTAEDLTAPRTELGTYLISAHVPAGMADPAARAVYSPDEAPDAPADVWWFRGWLPTCPAAPEHTEATGRDAVDGVVTDALGAPVYWIRDGDPAEAIHETSRLLVHWEAEQDLPAVWRVRALAPDGSTGAWELCEAGGEWTAGLLPHLPQRDDVDDLLD